MKVSATVLLALTASIDLSAARVVTLSQDATELATRDLDGATLVQPEIELDEQDFQLNERGLVQLNARDLVQLNARDFVELAERGLIQLDPRVFPSISSLKEAVTAVGDAVSDTVKHPAVIKANACAAGFTLVAGSCIALAAQHATGDTADHLTTAVNGLNLASGISGTLAALGLSSKKEKPESNDVELGHVAPAPPAPAPPAPAPPAPAPHVDAGTQTNPPPAKADASTST